MSTGMSSLEQVRRAVYELRCGNVPQIALLVCTSKYPAPIEDLNLRRIYGLKEEFPDCVIGYSGHEVGLWTTLCAVAMGAKIVERHITLDRSMKGSDHAASLEPKGLQLLVREIRAFERARGSSDIRVLDCEQADIKRLRG
jgi:sialic acid synthase SpsE